MLGLALALLWPSPALAEACPPAEGAWVALGYAPERGVPVEGDGVELLERVRVLLQAELERRHVAVCLDEPAGPPPSARIRLLLQPHDPRRNLAVEITIDDTLTSKRVSRRIELGRMPLDGRALTIAVGADELLSASWAELSLSRRREPMLPPAPPAIAREAVQARRRIELSLSANGEIDAAQRPRAGASLENAWWLTPGLALSFRLGYLRGLAMDAPNGSVRSDDFLAAGGLSVPVWQGDSLGLDVGVAARYMRSLVRGEPAPGALGSSGAYSSFAGEADVRGWFALSPEQGRPRWALVSDLRLGMWLREADARDGQTLLALQRSPLLGVGIGVALKIP